MRTRRLTAAAAVMVATLSAGAVSALTPSQKAIQDHYTALARAADPAFTAGDAKRGEAFFMGRHAGGKADSPSCTTCHTNDLKRPGQTRAGKEIAPMATSINPKRYGDPAEVEKWFKRNCSDVLGRECTAKEKSDVLAFLLSL